MKNHSFGFPREILTRKDNELWSFEIAKFRCVLQAELCRLQGMIVKMSIMQTNLFRRVIGGVNGSKESKLLKKLSGKNFTLTFDC